MTEESIYFNSDGMRLEGVLSYEEKLVTPPVALICPPHPNLGGDMDNNVIMALARELSKGGYATLRFNYRGVGGSEGPFRTVAERFRYWESTFGEGNLEGPLEDTKSALSFLKASVSGGLHAPIPSTPPLPLLPPNKGGVRREGGERGVFIVGYSFGAVMGIRVGTADDAVVAIAGIATPCAVYNLDCLSHSEKPKLFICSDSDFATSVEDTRMAFEKFSEPKRLVVKTNVSHFYTGSEQEVTREVLSFFNETSGH